MVSEGYSRKRRSTVGRSGRSLLGLLGQLRFDQYLVLVCLSSDLPLEGAQSVGERGETRRQLARSPLAVVELADGRRDVEGLVVVVDHPQELCQLLDRVAQRRLTVAGGDRLSIHRSDGGGKREQREIRLLQHHRRVSSDAL
ncbi:hypothetical protein PENTCL1PPCAC_18940 [Pristionchus entomophagus]|uniref:Uncharacterized protein n=1 Tax=Pristionchus entomophagus TaxID=358040 RepID=A0AAV5TR58_9BILA|nr:hypothetical protein PENTCL1PPCAC_18940 [Pristionchus entomophagus]